MTECALQLIDDCWTCTDCGWRYVRKGIPVEAHNPPRRCCPNSPDINTPEHRENIKQKMLAEIEPTAAIIAQLDQCLTPCKEFNGQTCTFRGSACKKWQRWKEFMLLTGNPCKYFDPSPGQPTP